MVRFRELTNGIRVVLESMDYLQSVSFSAWVKSGSAYETKSQNGMAHMIEHMLFKGTENRSGKAIADDMAKIGGNMNAYTTKEHTVFYVTTLEEHLGEAVDIIGDMLQNPKMDTEDFRKEKGVILDEIEMYEDSPEDMVHEMMQNCVWEDHPLGFLISGTAENVRGFTKRGVEAFMHQGYTAGHIILSIAGSYDEDEAMAACEQAFGRIPKGVCFPELTVPAYVRSFYTREQDIEQIHLNMAFPCIASNSGEKYLFAVANTMFGGSESSRLFQEIREELGMSYSVFSYGSPFEKAGLWHVDMVVSPSNLPKACRRTLEVAEQLRKEGITGEELARTKEQIKAEIIISSESAKNRAQRNGKAMVSGSEMMTTEQEITRLVDIPEDAVREFYRKYLDIQQLSLSFVGRMDITQMKEVQNIFDKL